MTAYSTSQANLIRTFDKNKLFEPAERAQPRFWDAMKEAPKTELRGSGFYFRIVANVGHGVGNPAEGGDYSTARTRTEVQCVVTGARMDSVVQVSKDFLDASEGEGSFSGDSEAEVIAEAALQLYTYADILLGAGTANGKLAEVEGAVSTSATVVLAWPLGAYQLRPGQYITVQSAGGTDEEATGVYITDIDYTTPQIVLNTTVNLTDGAGIYNFGGYNKTFPNGVGNVIDDGDEAATLYGVTRSSNTFMNAYGDDGSGSLDDFSESEIDKFLDVIRYKQDKTPNRIRTNAGLAAAAKKIFLRDRFYPLQGRETPKGQGGMNQEAMGFVYGDQMLKWEVDRNLPARTLYADWTPGWRLHVLSKADWFRDKDSGAIFAKAIASTTAQHYAYSWVGSMYMNLNCSHRRPNANGRRRNFKDPNVPGDVA